MKAHKLLIATAALILLSFSVVSEARHLLGCPCGYWIKQLGMCKLCRPAEETSKMDDPVPTYPNKLFVKWCSTSTASGRMCFAYVRQQDGTTDNTCAYVRPDANVHTLAEDLDSGTLVFWYWERSGQSGWKKANPTNVGPNKVYEFDC